MSPDESPGIPLADANGRSERGLAVQVGPHFPEASPGEVGSSVGENLDGRRGASNCKDSRSGCGRRSCQVPSSPGLRSRVQ